MSTRRMGLYVLFASLSVLFAASLVGYWITRAESPIWRAPGTPGLPAGLWLSGVVVVAISVAMELGLAAVRRNQLKTLSGRLWVALALVLLFLAVQVTNWREMHGALAHLPVKSLFPYTFYLLTGLHAAHVVGGLVPLGIVIWRANAREYSSSRYEGLALCTQYWHFLAAVWFVLFVSLEVGSS